MFSMYVMYPKQINFSLMIYSKEFMKSILIIGVGTCSDEIGFQPIIKEIGLVRF